MTSESPINPIIDDPSAVDAARERLAKPTHRFPWLRHKSHPKPTLDIEQLTVTRPEPSIEQLEDPCHVIDLGNPPLQSATSDEYRWAVVYENQRGIFLFSTPYFSRLSLLPTDPLPYTFPSASTMPSEQPNFTLDSYPLPSGQWKWISKQWMIDMQSGGGQVQYDGFEYNWSFRRHHWKSEVGKMGANGLVRRRKWIRLMVLPQVHRSVSHNYLHPNAGGSTPAWTNSSVSSHHSPQTDICQLDQVWIDDDSEECWRRYLKSLTGLPSDGHRIEAWCDWMGLPSRYVLHHQPVQWSEDGNPSRLSFPEVQSTHTKTQPLHMDTIFVVLSKYYEEILRSFIYPQSRADFLKVLVLSGAVGHLDHTAKEMVSQSVDFWSYTQEQ